MIQPFKWQQKAADQIVSIIRENPGCLEMASTGVGKTYVACNALRQLLEAGDLDNKESYNPLRILWVTPAGVKNQSARVLKEYGILNKTLLLSYGQLRGKDGNMFYKEHTMIVSGQERIIFEWNPAMLPGIVVFDECQGLKNETSIQTMVGRSVPTTVKKLFISATPYTKISEARSVVQGVGMKSAAGVRITNDHAHRALVDIAWPRSPDQWSPSAMKRLTDLMKPYIATIKGVQYKFKARCDCVLIDFESKEERESYRNAYREYLEEIAITKGWTGHSRWAAILVSMQKFRQRAELIRAKRLADRILWSLKEEKQVILASNFVDTIRSVWKHLTKAGISPDDVAHLIGGMSLSQRQKMIDEFNEGRRSVMLFTMRTGGVGISLHHDRPEGRPRHIILPPTWSAIEMCQAVGRAHRVTSISPTTQEIVWYKGTIEEQVAEKVALKVKCINKAIVAKEQFVSLFSPREEIPDDSIDEDIEVEEGIDESAFE